MSSEVFDNFVRENGDDPLNFEQVPALIRPHLQVSRANFLHRIPDILPESEPGVNFEVGYLNRRDFNAYAATDQDLIAVNVGIPMFFWWCMGTLLGRKPDFFPWAEPGNEMHFRMIGDFLAEAGCQSVFLHEMGHIARGHTAYLRDRFGMAQLREIRARTGNPVPGLNDVLLGFEVEADQFSIAHLIRVARINGQPLENPFFERVFGLGATRAILAMAANYLWLRESDETARRINAEDDHPPGPYRQRIILEGAVHIFVQNNMFSQENGAEMSMIAADMAEEIIATVRGTEIDSSQIARAFADPEAEEEMQRFIGLWEQSRALAAPFARHNQYDG